MPKQSNQHLPRPPIEGIEPHVRRYWAMRKTDKQILELLLKDHIDTTKYGLSINTFRKMRAEMGLIPARGQRHNVESIHKAIQELREVYPLAGARDMASLLFFEYGMRVARFDFRLSEPELLKQRKKRHFQRRRYWAAGVNDVICVDQHDKWKRFGLAFHVGEDPFAGTIHWMKVWHNNNNPKLILSYYLEWVERNGFMPLITQSDLGTENYGIANAQSLLRQWHDPRLEGTVQHRWMRSKKNVKPEIAWSQFRRRWTPGFQTILEKGVIEGWYDITRPLDALTFRWLFIPYIQHELDAYVNRINNTKKRKDRNKILPHGPPNDIFHCPERYGALDFKVQVQPEAVEHVRHKFAAPDDPVFDLVPSPFAELAAEVYAGLGTPELTARNIWDIYRKMIDCLEMITVRSSFRTEQYIDALEEFEIISQLEDQRDETIPHYPLIEGRGLLGGFDHRRADGSVYLGGVNGGLGLDTKLEEKLDEMDADIDENFSGSEEGGLIFTDKEDGMDSDEIDDW